MLQLSRLAVDSVRNLQSDLSHAESEYQSDSSSTNESVRSGAYQRYQQHVLDLQQRLAQAQSLVNQGPEYQQELSELKQVNQYAALIAPVATIYVRFTSDGELVPVAK